MTITPPPGRWALVTGASRGIGAALAVELAAAGWNVIIVGRDIEGLARVSAAVTKRSVRCLAEAYDLQDLIGWEPRIRALDDAVGGIDLVIANAGVRQTSKDSQQVWDGMRAVVLTNIAATWITLATLAPRMVQRGRGQLVGVGSFAGDRGYKGSAVYCASKAALRVYLEGLRETLHHTNIVVTELRLGYVDTDMTRGSVKHGAVLSPEDAARECVRAIARKRQVAWIPASTGILSFLLRFVPKTLIRRARR